MAQYGTFRYGERRYGYDDEEVGVESGGLSFLSGRLRYKEGSWIISPTPIVLNGKQTACRMTYKNKTLYSKQVSLEGQQRVRIRTKEGDWMIGGTS